MHHGSNFDATTKERRMIRRILLIPLLLAALATATAAAQDNPLLGTWRLKSFVREVAETGERYNQMGERPDGYLSYAADGRMLAFFVSDNQIRPQVDPTDEERIKLHKGMLAYGGAYKLSSGKVVHHIDIEWDGRRLGTEQVRFYAIEGDTLVIKTESNKSPVDGREGVGVLTFERVRSVP
jgi:Lipocalin-like domain